MQKHNYAKLRKFTGSMIYARGAYPENRERLFHHVTGKFLSVCSILFALAQRTSLSACIAVFDISGHAKEARANA